MRYNTIIIIMSLCVILCRAQQQTTWGDMGDGTYRNPILNADYSDPDAIRVGNKYYMVASDFHFTGMQVLESEDLVNWRIISQVYDRFDFPGWDSNKRYAGGSWAPSIRYHDGLYYVFFCTPHEGLFMSTASNPRGPWAPLHCVKKVEKWEDPCPIWDEDGQAYLGHSVHGAGPIIVHRMSTDGKRLLDDGITVYQGPVAEGTKWLKRDGYYYLSIPEGGVRTGWQTMLRARNIYGPYERRIVLEQGSTAINGPHQGSLIDTPNGEWWFIHFQSVTSTGRVVHLQPARWRDGWIEIGEDYDGNGVGEPVTAYSKPISESDMRPEIPAMSDDFTGNGLFWRGQEQSALGLQWQWCHNPVDSAWSLTERDGWLTLHAMQADSLRFCRNMLTQKSIGQPGTVTTAIDCSGITPDTYAGLLFMGKTFRAVGVCRDGIFIEANGKRTIVDSKVKAVKDKPCVVWLRAEIDNNNNINRFYYSTDGKRFVPAGASFPMLDGYWKGTRPGLFCYNTKENGGTARFDYFHYDLKKALSEGNSGNATATRHDTRGKASAARKKVFPKLFVAPNTPIGTGHGIHPGRVTWVHAPGVASWDGKTGLWVEDRWNCQAKADELIRSTMTSLTGTKSPKKAWQALFKNFNKEHGRGSRGYRQGEKIAIKLNMNNAITHRDTVELNSSPFVTLALVRSLINDGGVAQSDIIVCEPSRAITDSIYNKVHRKFPGVVFIDNIGGDGRVKCEYYKNRITYSADNGRMARGLARCIVDADYLINSALLKTHNGPGVTLTAKNWYGATDISLQWRQNAHNNISQDKWHGKPGYKTFVDFMAHKDMGGKCMLFLIDGTYGSRNVNGAPAPKWQKEPFNGDWCCSLIASQDGVACDAVAMDMLIGEWPEFKSLNYCDEYLREAASLPHAPSGTVYKQDGKPLDKPLGIMEHWNNSTERKYTKIELIYKKL